MGFPRQEYWSGLLFPSPGNLPNPGLKPELAALAGGFFTTGPPGTVFRVPHWSELDTWPLLVAVKFAIVLMSKYERLLLTLYEEGKK